MRLTILSVTAGLIAAEQKSVDIEIWKGAGCEGGLIDPGGIITEAADTCFKSGDTWWKVELTCATGTGRVDDINYGTGWDNADCSGYAPTNTKHTTGVCIDNDDGTSTKYTAKCIDVPCFGRETRAVLESGESVLMSSLKAGDYVLPGPTRVIVNQHAKAPELQSTVLEIQHADGEIKLTPDHVLSVNGQFIAAREATVGTKLGESEVSRVTKSVGGIINPLTTSGKITADGVLSSTYPEWIAGFAMSYPIYLTAANVLSFLFPASTQAYYDAHLEKFFQSTVSSLKTVPVPLKAFAFLVADLAVSAGLVVYTLASLKVVLAVVAATAITQARK